MAVEGFHHLYTETHHWSESLAFWRALGFELEENNGTSGLLRCAAGGPYIYLAEVPEDRAPITDIYLAVTDETIPAAPAKVVWPFTSTHWGTREMAVVDPDGRVVKLVKPGS
jgi:catechol 2,3-dioxygenase-like lactoylglutathione lyase family enzyme